MQIRCPHCHQPIELVSDDPSGDLTCPSCGSCFNLAKDAETARYDGLKSDMLGHFQLLHCLGQGAFGSVWKARDTELDRTVAIKIPRREQLTEADSEKFLREARAAAQVRHPNIVSVHEVGREEGRIYIASEFIEGASLDQWVKAHRLSIRESVELCAKIAEALHHSHQVGVVHRDLKPQNILVDASGEPHVADFGLAKRETGEITMTVEGQILGTPAYMSPEQARGDAHQADGRSDIYSLGVILFWLLTNELPFRGKQQMLIVQILNEEPPRPRSLDARIPRDLETICLKCLEKDPARRYESAQSFAEDLRLWFTGHSIRARPIGRLARSWRWCRRNPVVSMMTASIVALLIAGVGVSSYFAVQSSNRAIEVWLSNEGLKHADRVKENIISSGVLALYLRDVSPLVRVSPDGLNIVTAGPQNAARLWDAPSGRVIQLLTGHTAPIRDLAFSRSWISNDLEYWRPPRIASVSDDGTLKIWSIYDEIDEQPTTLFASDAEPPSSEERLKSQSDSSEKASERDNVLPAGAMTCVAFSPDGSRVASGNADRTVRIWSLGPPVKNGVRQRATGELLRTLRGHIGPIMSVAFDANGERIVSGGQDQTIKIWNAESGEEALSVPLTNESIVLVAFNVAGNRIFSLSASQNVSVHDATTGFVVSNESFRVAPVPTVSEISSDLQNVPTFNPSGSYLQQSNVILGR